MTMLTASGAALATALLAAPIPEAQRLDVRIDPAAQTVHVEAAIAYRDGGAAQFKLSERAEIDRITFAGSPVHFTREANVLDLDIPDGTGVLHIVYAAVFDDDVAAGERPGQIHNFSVDAHVGADGVFLSDGSDWHPRPLDDGGRPLLHLMSVRVAPMDDGWVLVASGDPAESSAIDEPCWSWETPRPVDGAAIAGNRHVLHGVRHETPHGAVEVVMHVPPEHAELAPLFVDAACNYLDLYTPLLGAFPYRRFSIVENFFSSGFAFPGFTVLGPRVVGMAPRSLAPGYLDHELMHNWWGNGVYVDPEDGNWCEALTSYSANYYRRVAEDGVDAGRSYRRGVLMKLSTDPQTLDDGPLATFGSADPSGGGPDRFVGYDKGAFVFVMLADRLGPERGGVESESALWDALRGFADANLGRRAGWADLQEAAERTRPERPRGWLDGFFAYWVREHHVPRTVPGSSGAIPADFVGQFPPSSGQAVTVRYGPSGDWCEIDPDFRVYRVLPPSQIVPTIAGTLGTGGLVLDADESRGELAALVSQLDVSADGENVLLVGAGTIRANAGLLARAADSIGVEESRFTVGGVTYDGRDQAVLHTMSHPDRPGRFVTVFHSNGETGWSRLRVVPFYTRDSTIVWDGGRVIERRVFEPDRRIRP